MREEQFGRLLRIAINSIATFEGITAPLVDDDLAAATSLSFGTIQNYKNRHVPPNPRTVEILAEAGVRRGMMGREWLQRFLHAARYPAPEKLLDVLFPAPAGPQKPPRIPHNLEAPTYSQFVMRKQAFAEVIDGLQQRSAVVVIVGLGGNGKTSLAREVAGRCLQGDTDVPRFDAVVWVSDSDHWRTTNLSVVLDEIARTLGYPGFTMYTHDEKLYEVAQLLKGHRVLVVVDNFETITDGALLTWLLRLPEPSKAIVTSREYRRGGWPVELRGMSEVEAWEFIAQCLRVLGIEKLVSDQTQLEPLLMATGGNPKAIELALGQVKYERRSLPQVVDDLYAARTELFDVLFTRAWALLDEVARRVLLVMTFFPASVSSEALSVTADVQGFAFDRAVERLTDLALLDVQHENLNSEPRYTLHPLVRAFAGTKLAEQPSFAGEARGRWVTWYRTFVEDKYLEYALNRPEVLDLLDSEQINIDAVRAWVQKYGPREAAFDLETRTWYADINRGRSIAEHFQRICELCGEPSREADKALYTAYYVQNLSRLRNQDEVDKYCPLLDVWVHRNDFPRDVIWEVRQALALAKFYIDRDMEAARRLWEENLQDVHDLQNRSLLLMTLTRRGIGDSYYEQKNYTAALDCYRNALQDAQSAGYRNGEFSTYIRIVKTYAVQPDIALAREHFQILEALAVDHRKQSNLADFYHVAGLVYKQGDDRHSASAAFEQAKTLYDKLGMRHESHEAGQELDQL